MPRIVNMDVFKFESKISRYKQVADVRILCFVYKAGALLALLFTYVLYWYGYHLMLLFAVDKIVYEHIESVYFKLSKLILLK